MKVFTEADGSYTPYIPFTDTAVLPTKVVDNDKHTRFLMQASPLVALHNRGALSLIFNPGRMLPFYIPLRHRGPINKKKTQHYIDAKSRFHQASEIFCSGENESQFDGRCADYRSDPTHDEQTFKLGTSPSVKRSVFSAPHQDLSAREVTSGESLPIRQSGEEKKGTQRTSELTDGDELQLWIFGDGVTEPLQVCCFGCGSHTIFLKLTNTVQS